MNSLFRANSIRRKLVFLGIVLTVFTASIVGLTSVNISSQAIIKHIKVLAVALAEDLAAKCVRPFLSDDFSQFKDTINTLRAVPHIGGEHIGNIMVIDNKGNVIAQNNVEEPDREHQNAVIKKAVNIKGVHLLLAGRYKYEVIAPVEKAGKRLGIIIVECKVGHLVGLISNIWKTFFIILIILIGVGAVGCFGFCNTIVEPIQKLADATARISKGDLTHRIKIKSGDELGRLADSFNKMAEDLQKTTVSKDYADNIIRSIIDALIVTDAEGKIETVNQATLDFLGYKEEELIGKPAGRLFAEDPLLEETCLKRIIKEGSVRNYETTGRAKEGKPVPVIISGSVMKDKDGNILGIVEIVKDITRRKRAEEERRRLEAQLLRAQKIEAIGTLAGGVAHDLNNILGGLTGYPELLLLDLPEDSPLRVPILTIKESGERAAAIVQDLLTQARRGVAVAEVVNLNHIIAEYLKSLEYEKLKSCHTKVHVETNLETNLLNIWGSPVHLSKTVMNLVGNASEAMPDGGTIFISTENRYIDRPIRGYDHIEEGDYVILRVSDTGVGISSEDIQKIFEPFYTKKKMGRSGTGLGMTVVWGTVKDHKGYIDVKSAAGKGTTFMLYFPVIRKEVAKDKPLLSIEDYMARGESILVVDDVEEQREIASRILKRLGYSVASVSSGEEAIDYMKNNSADLLVLDMIMDPGIDGLETYKRILEFNPGQKAIIVSGFSETERVKAAQRLGAGAYVKKPYLLEKVGIAVRDELDVSEFLQPIEIRAFNDS